MQSKCLLLCLLFKKQNPPKINFGWVFSDLVGIRTQDPIIKSDMLYQLSYEIILLTIFFTY